MTTVLLTGFAPFGGDATNPSGEAVHLVAERWRGPETLVTDVLPVAFDAAADRLRRLVDEHEPDVVIAAGLAANRSAVTPERVAVNLRDARIPDNDGDQPNDAPCIAGAPAAHFATLPVKAITAAMIEAGVAASLSYSAGTFVCNHLMFAALDHVPAGVRAGFVHVPWARESAPADAAALPMIDIVRALEIAVRTTLDAPGDLRIPGGTIS
jgi:pyroglutamyl-peptidase